jgi:hypothetical protein
MSTLHTFGCSITQGFALPDVVQPLLNSDGVPLTSLEIRALGSKFNWEQVHLYKPSDYAWPAVLAQKLNVPHHNYARRGACFQQIARQCAVHAHSIKPTDTVIVMWTYLSRLSLQWPARTAVPFCNIADPQWDLRTVILGINKFFGLSHSASTTESEDARIQKYIETAAHQGLDPMGIYNHYYNNLVLQAITHGFLSATGARVIHLSVETQSVLDQLEIARSELEPSLQRYSAIPDPTQLRAPSVDYDSCRVIHDPSIPPAENDMHPSVLHHSNFAQHLHTRYFQNL